ncbi:MAG: glycosyltransferase family 2 protein [Chromatiales bacterium]|nr:glycosyltransferase family 2 protein [Chromatiales bacterium]
MTATVPKEPGSGAAWPVSAVLIVRDAEATLAECLASLAFCAEVVVYDNGSQDRSAEIARRFPNVRLQAGEFTGFGPTKNRAAALASHDWILSIDADEAVTPALAASLRAADLTDPAVVYAVWRHNFLLGRRVRFSGWGRDWLPRVYHRTRARLTDAAVHENLTFDPGVRVERLEGPLRHAAVRDVGELLVKVNRYSELRRRTRPVVLPAPVILLRATWAFFRTLVLQAGFLDGWRGLVIAWSNANGVFFKYMKPYADAAVRAEAGAGTQRPEASSDS